MSPPSKESQSAASAPATVDPNENKPAKRTPLPFWKMSRYDGTEYWLPFVKGHAYPIPEHPSHRPAPSNASANNPLNINRLGKRGHQDSGIGLLAKYMDDPTRRRCLGCGRPQLLRDYVRSSTKYGTLQVHFQTCNHCIRRRRKEKMTDEEFAKWFQGGTD